MAVTKEEFEAWQKTVQEQRKADEEKIERLQKEIGILSELVQKSGMPASHKKALIVLKNITPWKLDKPENWKTWKTEIQDYCEEVNKGMSEILKKAAEAKEEIQEEEFDPEWWAEREGLIRFLKRYTANDANRIVTSVGKKNGWEAWRKLCQ